MQTWEKSDRVAYKQCYKESKRAAAVTKARAYDQLYEKLVTKDGQGKIFELAR